VDDKEKYKQKCFFLEECIDGMLSAYRSGDDDQFYYWLVQSYKGPKPDGTA